MLNQSKLTVGPTRLEGVVLSSKQSNEETQKKLLLKSIYGSLGIRTPAEDLLYVKVQAGIGYAR
jgi:hypothetical protein